MNQQPTWVQILRALREVRGVSQEGWAALLGVADRTVRRWERGAAVPDAHAEAALVTLAEEKGLFRAFPATLLGGRTLTPEVLRAALAAGRTGQTFTLDAGPASTPAEPAPSVSEGTASPTPPPNNLPAALPRFVGRETERTTTAQRLSTARLLTLTGPGGAGKTRLALQVANDLLHGQADGQPRFSGGVWLVELASITAAPNEDAAGAVSSAIGAVLGVREQAGQTLAETIGARLAGQHVLVILDNCEHVVGACATVASELLRRVPGLSVLATSRERLGLGGEVVLVVPSMAVPPAHDHPGRPDADVATLLGYDAVQLFVERAHAATGTFELVPGNAAAVGALCRGLDGIPLAIELAAARVRLLPVEEIAARLRDRFRLLTGGDRTARRHQTLRAAVEWGYDLLGATEQKLFERLSVFRGGFTLEAVTAICGDGDTSEYDMLDLLGGLVDKSFIQREPGESSRYSMLETLRDFGAEKLAGHFAERALRTRHRDWYLDLAERAVKGIAGPNQRFWLDILTREHPNLRTALAWCREDPDGGIPQVRMVVALGPFWELRGFEHEAHEWMTGALAAAPGAPSELRAAAQIALGRVLYQQSRFDDAVAQYTDALALAVAGEHQHSIASALANLGNIEFRRGRYDAAANAYERVPAISRDIGNEFQVARMMTNLAMAVYNQGDNARSRALMEESLALKRRPGDQAGIAVSLTTLANTVASYGDLEGVRTLQEQALALKEELGDIHGSATSLTNLALIAIMRENFPVARSYVERVVALRPRLRDAFRDAGTLAVLVPILLREGREAVAAQVSGLVERALTDVGGSLEPRTREVFDAAVDAVRARLGPEAFDHAFSAGRALSLNQGFALTSAAPAPVQA